MGLIGELEKVGDLGVDETGDENVVVDEVDECDNVFACPFTRRLLLLLFNDVCVILNVSILLPCNGLIDVQSIVSLDTVLNDGIGNGANNGNGDVGCMMTVVGDDLIGDD
jgi:hypothetical protein